MLKKILALLAIAFAITVLVIFKLQQPKEKSAMQNSFKTKFLCEAKLNCNYHLKQIPKGVCLPDGVCRNAI